MVDLREDELRFDALLSDFFRAGPPDDEEDDDMFDGDEPEREEVDHQTARWDHERDHRKHGECI